MLAATLDRQRGTLLLWAPVAFATGIGWYFAQRVEPDLLPLVWATLGLTVLVLAGWRWPMLRGVLILLALAVAGAAAAKWQTERTSAPVLTQEYWGPVTGRLVGIDRSAQNKLRILLDQVYLPGVPQAETPARVRLVVARPPPDSRLFAGAHLMTRARLGPPPPPVEPQGFDFRRHAWFMRLGAIGFATAPVVLATPRAPPEGELVLLDARLRLAAALRAEMPGRAGGFAAAILTGERSGVDPADLVDLRASNLAHLLAISGLHMGLLCGVVFGVTRLGFVVLGGAAARWPSKKLAAGAALAAGLGYLLLSGASVATQRAFVMAAVMLVAVMIDRPALTLRAVAVAALIVLALRPVALVGPGFQMSFAATVALIACYDGLKRWRLWMRLNGVWGGALRWGIGLVVTAAVAGAATAPFSAFHFNQLTSYGLLANIAAVPAMGLLVMPAGLLALILWPLGLQAVPLWAMEMGINHILAVAHWAATLEGAVRPVASGPPWVIAVIALGGVMLAALRGAPRLLGVVPMAIAVGAWAQAERPAVLVAPDGKLIGAASAEGRVLNRPRGQGFAARVWLENDGERVDQRTAAARDWPEAVVVWTSETAPSRDDCRAKALLIAPAHSLVPVGPCRFLGADALQDHGAHAYFADKLDSPLTTRAVTGVRPWAPLGQ